MTTLGAREGEDLMANNFGPKANMAQSATPIKIYNKWSLEDIDVSDVALQVLVCVVVGWFFFC